MKHPFIIVKFSITNISPRVNSKRSVNFSLEGKIFYPKSKACVIIIDTEKIYWGDEGV